MGSSVLMLGAGPTGLVLAQLLRQNGGCHVVVAAPQGVKMDLAKNVSHDQKQQVKIDSREADKQSLVLVMNMSPYQEKTLVCAYRP